MGNAAAIISKPCGSSTPRTTVLEAYQRSRKIDADLEADLVRQKRVLKLLLLGPGESGKSTFVKQMKILHMQGFSDADRKTYIPVIHGNILEAMKLLLSAMHKLNETVQDSELQVEYWHQLNIHLQEGKLLSCTLFSYLHTVVFMH